MGREIRRVPPNWQHPLKESCPHYPTCDQMCYQPKYEQNIDDALNEWLKDFDRVRAGNMDDFEKTCYASLAEWIKDNPPPDLDYYVNYKKEEATWYQVYQTVSEGSPVTPPFATQEELIDYLVENGDFWDQERAKRDGYKFEGYSRNVAEKFVMGSGWVPSMVMTGGVIKQGIECATEIGE